MRKVLLRFREPNLSVRAIWYVVFLAVSVLSSWKTLSLLTLLAFKDDRYSYTIVIPFISAALLWIRRSGIFLNFRTDSKMGIPTLISAALLYAVAAAQHSGSLWLAAASIVLIWIAGFLWCFGLPAVSAARFPLLLLWLMVPLPDPYMNLIEVALQKASAEMAYGLFRLTGMPVFRQGLVFSLPGVDIEVAEACSGIRSSVSLVIVVLVASQLFLTSGWRQLSLTLLAIPVVIFKNALRITAISWLGTYVSRDFFHGDLHRYGGLPFSLLAIALLIPILWALQASERRSAEKLRSPAA